MTVKTTDHLTAMNDRGEVGNRDDVVLAACMYDLLIRNTNQQWEYATCILSDSSVGSCDFFFWTERMKIGQFTVSYGNDEQHILFLEKMGTENVFCLFCWKLISCTIHRVLVSANTNAMVLFSYSSTEGFFFPALQKLKFSMKCKICNRSSEL